MDRPDCSSYIRAVQLSGLILTDCVFSQIIMLESSEVIENANPDCRDWGARQDRYLELRRDFIEVICFCWLLGPTL